MSYTILLIKITIDSFSYEMVDRHSYGATESDMFLPCLITIPIHARLVDTRSVELWWQDLLPNHILAKNGHLGVPYNNCWKIDVMSLLSCQDVCMNHTTKYGVIGLNIGETCIIGVVGPLGGLTCSKCLRLPKWAHLPLGSMACVSE